MPASTHQAAIEAVADALAALYGKSFGGKATGRYRISRKALRMLAGRRSLTPWLVDGLVEALFERGYVLIPAESYFVVVEQKLFNSYRRVTAAAIAAVLGEPLARAAAASEATAHDDDGEAK